MSTIFDGAMGERYENPDPEWLKHQVFNAGDDFWEGASGGAVISYQEEGRPVAGLTLIGREAYGFLVLHIYNNEPRTHTLTTGQHTGETAEVYIGGEPATYWREHFVPKETAWEALDHFLRTGQRKESLKWEIHEMPEVT